MYTDFAYFGQVLPRSRSTEVFSSGFCVVEVEDGQGGFGDVGDGAGTEGYFS